MMKPMHGSIFIFSVVKVQVTEEIDSGIDFDDSENQTYYREYRATVLQVFIGEGNYTLQMVCF